MAQSLKKNVDLHLSFGNRRIQFMSLATGMTGER